MNARNLVAFVPPSLPALCIGLGAAVLAAHPLVWLGRTWLDPAYGSHGYVAAALTFGLFAWSWSSPRAADDREAVFASRPALALLLLTSAVRAAGQVLAVNIVAAASLVLDVYALGVMAGLVRRSRPVSPGWLACVFVFALPLERVLQRCVGHGLQILSAAGSGAFLHTFVDEVSVHGVRMLIAGRDVLVDLPCSGARGLLNLILLHAVLMAVRRPRAWAGAVGVFVALTGALAANIVRITFLSLGLAFPEQTFGIDVMSQPWHDALGLGSIALGSIPILAWARLVRPAPIKLPPATSRRASPGMKKSGAALFLICAVAILCLPSKPVDVSQTAASLTLPLHLNGEMGRSIPLLPKENAYFRQYGGHAAKTQYGPYSVTLVRTSAPLRHLHNPDECLRGLGYEVAYLGVQHAPVQSAIYRAVDAQGTAWRVAVSFVSKGVIATNVSEAVWRCLQEPDSDWLAVQRLSPWDMGERHAHTWDTALAAALDIPCIDPQPEMFATRWP